MAIELFCGNCGIKREPLKIRETMNEDGSYTDPCRCGSYLVATRHTGKKDEHN